ncbi:pilin [Patescibacteria group bacterium]|nr:pilin [Patescibacteria group bacterium]
MSKKLTYLYIFLTSLIPAIALAGDPQGPKDIPDPFEQYADIEALIITITNYILSIAGLVSVAFIIVGGFQYITAGGNEEQTKKAMKTLTNATVGLILVFAAYAIYVTIKQALKINL